MQTASKIAILLLLSSLASANDQLPAFRRIDETIKCPAGRMRLTISEKMSFADSAYGRLHSSGDSRFEPFTWSKGNLEFRPLSIGYYLVSTDTLVGNALHLRRFEAIGGIGVTTIAYSTTRKFYVGLGPNIRLKAKLSELLWVQSNNVLAYETDKVFWARAEIGIGLQFAERASVLLNPSGRFEDLTLSPYSDPEHGTRYAQWRLPIEALYQFSRWFGVGAAAGLDVRWPDTVPFVSLLIRVVNWGHIL